MTDPRITLVTPSFNQVAFLEQTITSVLDQGYPGLQYIVMDGGSTDGSVELIRKYARHLAHWESHPDAGQTAAIAAGFRMASGDLVNWLNSDDYLLPGALSHVAKLASRDPGAALYAAATESFLDGERQPYHVSVPHGLDLHAMLGRASAPSERHQPGIFLRRSWYERVGGLDPSFNFTMDYDLYVRILAAGGRPLCDTRPIARFRSHRNSKTGGDHLNVVRTVRELMRSADAVGRGTGITPDHSQHMNTLCGGAVMAAVRRQWGEGRDCMRLAWRIGGVRGILATFGRAAVRKVSRSL